MANSELNDFAVTGYVADKPVLKPKENEGSVTKVGFHLKNPRMVGAKQFFNEFYIVVYGKKAKECLEQLCVGSKCTVTGSANTWEKIDPETGAKTSGVVVDAKEVFFG
ncbi:MAG: single-stranded DNA-binding protein [Acutalibacteraceae bacterium]|nr:single-stranded DNA-binding protein [Acutalibacteraceae bacterium]